MPILSLLSLLPTADAFCGAYVANAGSDIYNHASQIVITRQFGRTTLTLANDFEGDATEFAIVIPVPEVLGEADVQVVEPSVVERLDLYSAPRLVEYTCDDVMAYEEEPTDVYETRGCGGVAFSQDYAIASDAGLYGYYGYGEEADDAVVVEASFVEGAYQIEILSAEDSAGLMSWLDRNGYSLPAGAGDILQDYIDSGSYFFAAKVSLPEVASARSWLAPLQFGYESDVISLPIRLGTVNSAGQQDLIVYGITTQADGELGISNYPEVEVEQECMYDPLSEDFGAFYDRQLTEAMEESGAAWVKEYSWMPYHCDPCPSPPLTDDELLSLAFTDGAYGAHFTRLHLRYRPEEVTQDVTFYGSGDSYTQSQIRYIGYRRELEAFYPVCDVGWAEDPGECEAGVSGDTGAGAAGAAGGCAVSGRRELPWAPVAGLLLAGGALLRRIR